MQYPQKYTIRKIYRLLLLFALTFPLPAVRAQTTQEHISSVMARITAENRIVGELTIESLQNLPVGIQKYVNANRYIIAIDSAVFTEKGIYLSAMAELTLHESKNKIAFAARNIHMTPAGIVNDQPAQLVLVTPQRIAINEQVNMVLPADGHNYLEWDCYGFKAVNLKGIFEFSDQVFQPATRLAGGADKVQGSFEVHAADPENILLSIGITPFEIKGMDGMAFEVREASLDMSDRVNPPGMVFPAGYAASYGDMPELWQGFYLKETNVYLPEAMGGKNIQVQDMLIDEHGLSGHFALNGVLPFNEGDAGGWPFSIDRLSMTLAANKLTGGSMSGTLGIPFLGSDTIGYTAGISSGRNGLEYAFSATLPAGKTYNCPFGGTITLAKGCILQLETSGSRPVPSAILNGNLTLDNDVINIQNLAFEQLHLTAASPYITGGKFASSDSVGFSLAGFGLSIKDIGIAMTNGKATVGVTGIVALMGKDEKGISADADIKVKSTMETSGIRQVWRYEGTDVGRIGLDCKLSLFTLKGSIGLYRNHSVYGDGFQGDIDLSVDKFIPNGITADIRFGKKETFNYWFAKFGAPVVIPMGYITINGIKGGVYNRMKKENLYDINSNYIPDEQSGLGFMTGIGLSVIKKELLYAEPDFEIAFNTNFGVRFVQFSGAAQFFSGAPMKDDPPVKADINMFYDFDNHTFHAATRTWMNLAGALKGGGPGGLLGEAVIHSGPDDWYIYIGRPSAPFSIELLGIARAQTYFMAGTKIEDMPLPRSEVRSIIGNLDLSFMQTSSVISTGRGMGFGASFDVGIGIGRDKGFVYAFLDLGAGADIMLRDFGNASCENRSGPVGIDGWYASGQAYAYMQGKIGIRVKKREFDIMSVGVAALLRAELPNPVWMQGSIGARYKILGGLIKGSVTVDVTIGEPCKMADYGELGNIELIGDIQPAQGGEDVDVFAAPQVAFNTQVDIEFGMLDMNHTNNTYRVKLDEFSLQRPDKSSIGGSVQWNGQKDVAVLKTRDILPAREQLTITAKVHIEKKNGNQWVALTDGNKQTDYEIKTASFVTGPAPTTIPGNNVQYAYPLRNQYNFYQSETGNGYIRLKQGQPGLFYSSANNARYGYVARFSTPDGQNTEVPASYNESAATVGFNIPSGLLSSQVYEMQIVRKQIETGGIDRNVQRLEVMSDAGDSTVIAQHTLEGAIGSGGEKVLFGLGFRTSSFNTFKEKMNAMTGYKELCAVEHSLMSLLAVNGNMSETFDSYELHGNGEEQPPLVYAEAIRSNNSWLNNHVYPLVYELYGSDPALTLDRNISVMGLMPLKGMWIFNDSGDDYLLEETQKSSGITQSYTGGITCRYNVAYHVHRDYAELRDKAAAKYVGTNASASEAARRLLNGTLRDIDPGRYAFRLNYRLPGMENPNPGTEYGFNYLTETL